MTILWTLYCDGCVEVEAERYQFGGTKLNYFMAGIRVSDYLIYLPGEKPWQCIPNNLLDYCN